MGIYNWNNGSPDLMLFERNGVVLGRSSATRPIRAAARRDQTQGPGGRPNMVAFLQDGVERIRGRGHRSRRRCTPDFFANGTAQSR